MGVVNMLDVDVQLLPIDNLNILLDIFPLISSYQDKNNLFLKQ